VPQFEIFIPEFLPKYAFTTSSIVAGEIATLKHEIWNDTVETASCIPKPVLPSSQLAEVPSRQGDCLVEKFENYTARWLRVDRDVELGSWILMCLSSCEPHIQRHWA